MKKIPLLLMVMSLTANADCYMRSTVSGHTDGFITSVSDIQKWVGPVDNAHNKCIITFKALDQDNKWHSGSGMHTFSKDMPEMTGCAYALVNGKAEMVDRLFGKNIKGAEVMVCDESSPPESRPVAINEVVKLSDVSPHPTKVPFKYKGAECRWFVETSIKGQDFYQWQGVICKSGRPNVDTWQVVDKF